MKYLFLVLVLICCSSAIGQSKIPSAENQIKTALYACPKMYQDNVKILGYDEQGDVVTLKEGTGEMICLGDDPNKEGVGVSCYSNKLEAFMTRGRELIAEGKTEIEKREIRKKEIDAGTLMMPQILAAVYIVKAKQEDYDVETGELKSHTIRYAYYKPYMTGAETGLPTTPEAPGMPWLMDADTHRSHIMVTPESGN